MLTQKISAFNNTPFMAKQLNPAKIVERALNDAPKVPKLDQDVMLVYCRDSNPADYSGISHNTSALDGLFYTNR